MRTIGSDRVPEIPGCPFKRNKKHRLWHEIIVLISGKTEPKCLFSNFIDNFNGLLMFFDYVHIWVQRL